MNVSIEVEDQAWLDVPGLEDLTRQVAGAAVFAAGGHMDRYEIAVLFTSEASMADINARWRGQNKPTNVLSFPAPADMPVPAGEARPLGDIVLAHGVITREAAAQGKTLHDHTAHLIVHGVLHLLGHDHDDDAEAQSMERLETVILKGLGISDPYERH
ncbi:MAG: rRNA maturation RNase YbeY [Aestuariivirga sp.]|uniref:rRNA maturation RNase YbeY n=1 Tax=Aestuariivirga sp. TaxID=2650926 RepID=UPI0038D19E11